MIGADLALGIKIFRYRKQFCVFIECPIWFILFWKTTKKHFSFTSFSQLFFIKFEVSGKISKEFSVKTSSPLYSPKFIRICSVWCNQIYLFVAELWSFAIWFVFGIFFWRKLFSNFILSQFLMATWIVLISIVYLTNRFLYRSDKIIHSIKFKAQHYLKDKHSFKTAKKGAC